MSTQTITLTIEQANALERFRQHHTLGTPEELDGFRLSDISNALTNGYNVGTPAQAPVLKPKGVLQPKPDGAPLTREQFTIIEHWFTLFPKDKPFYLKKHQEQLRNGGWKDVQRQALNAVTVDELGLALFHGYRLTD